MPETHEVRLPRLRPIELDSYILDLEYFLRQDYADIGQAAEELPAIAEWVNEQLQSITEQRLIKKQEIKEVEASAYFDLKRGAFAERDYSGTMTEGALQQALVLEGAVKQVHREHAVLVGWHKRLTNLQFSFQSKLDLIRSTEATRRRLVVDHESQDDESESE
jgi:hypothetical protein